MSNEALISIIVLLVGAHYVSLVYEIRKVKADVDALRADVSAAALAAANAATAAATIAHAVNNK